MNTEVDTFIKIEDMIYEINDKQVMLNSEISITKCRSLIINKGVINHE